MDNSDSNKSEQTKPQTDKIDAGSVEISVVDPQGSEEILFKIKRSAKMRRLFNAYCERMGYDPDSMRFFYQGERINENDTPDSLVLKDGAKIDAFIKQVAG